MSLAQAQKATPATAAAYVAMLAHLALAQSRLQRHDEALATLTTAMDVLTSELLHSALAALDASDEPRCALKEAQCSLKVACWSGRCCSSNAGFSLPRALLWAIADGELCRAARSAESS